MAITFSSFREGATAPFSAPTDMTCFTSRDGSGVIDVRQYIKTVNYEVSEYAMMQVASDDGARDHIKRSLCMMLAEEAMKHARFTQIKDPHTHNVRVIGRLVIMSDAELKKLIEALR